MNTQDILIKLRDVFSADEDIKAWSNGLFYQEPIVYLGMDENNPPGLGNYPLIAVVGVSRIYGGGNTISREIDFACGVVQEEILVDDSNGATTHMGMLQAETLIEMAELSLIKACFGKLSFKGEHTQISMHPLYISYSTVTVEHIFEKKRR